MVRHACRVAGINYLSVMLFGVLSGVETLKICNGYGRSGEEIAYFPGTLSLYEKCDPVYVGMPGWKEELDHVTDFDQLPQTAKDYISKIEELTNTKVVVVSVGPDRTQTIMRDSIF